MIAAVDSVQVHSPAQATPKANTIATLQRTVSASRLNTWLQCRLKFYFRYVQQLSKPKTPSLHVDWGCKWGADQTRIVDEGGTCIIYEFYTAWSPPIEFLKKVAEQWSALMFVLAYEEPGIGFKGIAKFQGEVHEDHCISL
jgi:hypothetical protein